MWLELGKEMRQAQDKYGPFHSTHEGYGVLAEEVAELLDAIRSNNQEDIQGEAIQVAAVALRIALACENNDFRVRSGIK